MKKVFIDGKAGTTGLRIYERLSGREDIELITLPEELRKDREARRKALNSADIVFLCLPDDVARESVSLIDNPDTAVIDASTAHRTLPDWAYGFPELNESFEEKIKKSKRIAVPGCHASGFVALIYPLVEAGLIGADTQLTCFSLTGYSGGGNKMIGEYEADERDVLLDAPRQYALGQTHKHLPEMTAITGLKNAPIFCPIVSDFYSGMEVTVPLFVSQLQNDKTVEDVKKVYKDKYQGPMVKYTDENENGFASAGVLSGNDTMQISVFGNDDRILLVARFDNLGKGASGAAVECMNLLLGESATKCLEI